MKNLVYDLPLDCQELILKEKQLLDAKMNVINQLKEFDKVEWVKSRFDKHRFPYNCYLSRELYYQQMWYYKNKQEQELWRSRASETRYKFNNERVYWCDRNYADLFYWLKSAVLLVYG
jgi:hypothetical protein